MIDPYKDKNIKFLGNTFHVDKRVYVPTKETENLVKKAISFLKKSKKDNPLILDVGTGSGAIGISIAKKFPESKVIGLDISERALEVTKINKVKNKVKNFEMRFSDYIRSVSEEPDVIIADLPWGTLKYMLGSNKELDWEKLPKISFFPPSKDPLYCYEQLIKQILEKNWKTKLFIETGSVPKEITLKSLKGKVYKTKFIRISKDYSICEISFNGKNKIKPPEGHYHLLYYAELSKKRSKKLDNPQELKDFLYAILKITKMHALTQPILKKSNKNAWTALMGIVTSHISFHFWTDKNGPMKKPGIQFDLYSCKKFDVKEILQFLKKFLKPKESSYKYLDRSLGLKKLSK